MVSPWYCLWFSNKLGFFMNTEVGFYTAWSSTSKSTYHRPHFNAADALAVTLMSSRLDSSWIRSPLFNVRVIQCQISSWIQLSKVAFLDKMWPHWKWLVLITLCGSWRLFLAIQAVIDICALICCKPSSALRGYGQGVQHEYDGSLSLLVTLLPYVDRGLLVISFKD